MFLSSLFLLPAQNTFLSVSELRCIQLLTKITALPRVMDVGPFACVLTSKALILARITIGGVGGVAARNLINRHQVIEVLPRRRLIHLFYDSNLAPRLFVRFSALLLFFFCFFISLRLILVFPGLRDTFAIFFFATFVGFFRKIVRC